MPYKVELDISEENWKKMGTNPAGQKYEGVLFEDMEKCDLIALLLKTMIINNAYAEIINENCNDYQMTASSSQIG